MAYSEKNGPLTHPCSNYVLLLKCKDKHFIFSVQIFSLFFTTKCATLSQARRTAYGNNNNQKSLSNTSELLNSCIIFSTSGINTSL